MEYKTRTWQNCYANPTTAYLLRRLRMSLWNVTLHGKSLHTSRSTKVRYESDLGRNKLLGIRSLTFPRQWLKEISGKPWDLTLWSSSFPFHGRTIGRNPVQSLLLWQWILQPGSYMFLQVTLIQLNGNIRTCNTNAWVLVFGLAANLWQKETQIIKRNKLWRRSISLAEEHHSIMLRLWM